MLIHKLKLRSVVLATGLFAVFAFQNCGQLTPSPTAVLEQATANLEQTSDAQTIATVTQSPNLVFWISAQNPSLPATSPALAAIQSQSPGALVLAPVSGMLGPGIVTSQFLMLPMFAFTNVGAGSTQLSPLLATSAFSVIALLEGPLDGELYSINSGTPAVDDLSLSMASGSFVVSHSTDAGDSETLSVATSALSGPVVVAVSYGATLGDLKILVNGLMAQTSVVTTGSPAANTNVLRQLVIGGASSSLRVAEMMVVSSELAPYQLNSLSRYIANRWGDSNVIFDPSLLPGAAPGVGDGVPANVRSILTTNCIGCHAAFATNSLQDFETTSPPDVVPGNSSGSALYTMLNGAGGVMPLGGTPLSTADLATIQNWINNLQSN